MEHGRGAVSEPREEAGVRLRTGRRVLGVLLGASAYGAFKLLGRFPETALLDWVTAPGEVLSTGLGWASSRLPLPLAELLLLLLLVRWGGDSLLDARRARRTGEPWTRPAAASGLRVAGDLGVVALLFYLLWGFGYAANPIRAVVSDDGGTIRVGEVRTLAEEMVTAANGAYVRIHGTRDAGSPTTVPSSLGAVFGALDDGWTAAADELGLAQLGEPPRAPPKALHLGSWLRRVGVSGIYVPFTGEALVLPDLPAVALGKAVAHEGAHQRGIHHEADANFIAFIAASRAPDPLLRYSAYVFAQRQLMRALASRDPEGHRRLAGARLPGVRRDLEALAAYWRQVEGVGTRVGSRVNDAYLRRQGIPEGLAAYGASARHLVLYARARGGSLLPRNDLQVAEERPGREVP